MQGNLVPDQAVSGARPVLTGGSGLVLMLNSLAVSISQENIY